MILGDVVNDAVDSTDVVSVAFKELYVHCTIARKKRKAMVMMAQNTLVLSCFRLMQSKLTQ